MALAGVDPELEPVECSSARHAIRRSDQDSTPELLIVPHAVQRVAAVSVQNPSVELQKSLPQCAAARPVQGVLRWRITASEVLECLGGRGKRCIRLAKLAFEPKVHTRLIADLDHVPQWLIESRSPPRTRLPETARWSQGHCDVLVESVRSARGGLGCWP